MKIISILGSTGSVGRATVDIVTRHPDRFKIAALTAQNNIDLLCEQAIQLRPCHVVIGNEAHYDTLKSRLAGTGIGYAAGAEAIIDAARLSCDVSMAAIVGMAGLRPILAAITQGKCVAIANKEPLVAAGALVMAEAQRHGTTLLPVDSEHNAIFQCLEPENRDAVARLVLTASGGPFRTWSQERMNAATPEQAVAHPNWSMGAKISVDSASMMNKALELIEASILFSMPHEKIDVLVHPQSVIHSMVEYVDGSFLAQLGAPDMRTPIAHTLAWPGRVDSPGMRLDLVTLRRLDFEPLDHAKFPAVTMARECLDAGAWAPIVLNAANEVAVAHFLKKKIGFSQIIEVVRAALSSINPLAISGLDDILSLDDIARRAAQAYINKVQPLTGT
jgi:1-deoxy-D-xylulose-5-phosphate reductoisomerase